MKNKILKFTIFAFFVLSAFAFSARAFAMTPTLSLSANNNGSVSATVFADPNAPVILNYFMNNQWAALGTLGYTNQNGYLSTTINTGMYSISSGAQVVVVVNGSQSVATVWPTIYNGGQNSNIVLSTSSLNITQGQSQSVYISNGYNYNYGFQQYYITKTSGNAATATLNGNTITVYGQNPGTATFSVCQYNTYTYASYYYNTCATLYVTVSGLYNPGPYYPPYPPVYNPLTVSTANVQLTVGNSAVVTIGGGDSYNNYPYPYYGQQYYISQSNQSVATATLNGSSLIIYGNTMGTSTVVVCKANSSQCATVNVSVGAANYPYGNYGYGNTGYYPSQTNGWYYSYQYNQWMHY
jgi:hypothetical protein